MLTQCANLDVIIKDTNTMDKEFKDKIIKNIKETGFPSELIIADILRKHSYDVEQNGTYLDYELNKSREIDIYARKVFSKKENEISSYWFAISLVIEVKKSSKRPWIIFTTQNNKQLFSDFKGPAYGQINFSSNFSAKCLSAKEFMKSFPRNESSIIGTSFYEAFKSPDEPSKIYEAILSAVKASFYTKWQESGEDYLTEEEVTARDDEEYKSSSLSTLEVYIPTIILDGILCEATITNDEIDVNETEYIPLNISHSIKPYNKYFHYYPELLTTKYLEKFLKDLDIWGNDIIKSWNK